MYTQAPGLIRTISLVVIHKGVEVIIVRIGPSISAASIQLGEWIDWTVINHMPWDVASSTDPKIADIVGMSSSMTEITLGLQTMMCCVARHRLPAGGTDIHWAEEPVMTEIQTNIALDVGRAGV